MLAAGCPVVSTAMPEVSLYTQLQIPLPRTPGACGALSLGSCPTAVQVAHSHDEFIMMIRKVIDNPMTMEQRRAISECMSVETWKAKVGEILELVGG